MTTASIQSWQICYPLDLSCDNYFCLFPLIVIIFTLLLQRLKCNTLNLHTVFLLFFFSFFNSEISQNRCRNIMVIRDHVIRCVYSFYEKFPRNCCSFSFTTAVNTEISIMYTSSSNSTRVYGVKIVCYFYKRTTCKNINHEYTRLQKSSTAIFFT